MMLPLTLRPLLLTPLPLLTQRLLRTLHLVPKSPDVVVVIAEVVVAGVAFVLPFRPLVPGLLERCFVIVSLFGVPTL